MIIGDRLRTIRESKKLSQGDIEKRTGLLRVYISRVENGHTVPNLETLEKFAHALEVPLYHLFYEGAEPPAISDPLKGKIAAEKEWGASGEDARRLSLFQRHLGLMDERSRSLLLFLAHKLARLKNTHY